MELKQALELIDKYYERMERCSSTSGRRNNYEAILEIFRECPKVEKYWQHNLSKHKMVDRIVRIASYEEISKVKTKRQITYTSHEQEFAYIAFLPEEQIIKVGKTCKIDRRISELKRQYQKEVLLQHVFAFDNAEDAYLMEILLHKYFKEKYPDSFIPQDRFSNARYEIEDIEILNAAAEKIKEIIWF